MLSNSSTDKAGFEDGNSVICSHNESSVLQQCRLNLNLVWIDSLINTTEFKSNVNLHIWTETWHQITRHYCAMAFAATWKLMGCLFYLFSASSHLKISVILVFHSLKQAIKKLEYACPWVQNSFQWKNEVPDPTIDAARSMFPFASVSSRASKKKDTDKQHQRKT